MREYTKFYITPKGERAARSGHPWVYAEEITKIEGEYQNGDLVDVVKTRVNIWAPGLSTTIPRSGCA